MEEKKYVLINTLTKDELIKNTRKLMKSQKYKKKYEEENAEIKKLWNIELNKPTSKDDLEYIITFTNKLLCEFDMKIIKDKKNMFNLIMFLE